MLLPQGGVMDEELLEEARKAVHAAIPGSGDYAQWERHREAGFDMLGDIAKAVLTLAEKKQVDARQERFARFAAQSNAVPEMYESLRGKHNG